MYRTFLKNFKQNILHTSFITYIILPSITITFIPKNCNSNLSRIFLPHFHRSTILNITSSQLHHSTLSSAITPSSKIPIKTVPTFSYIFFHLPSKSPSSTSKKRHLSQFHKHSTLSPSSKIPIKTFSFHPPSLSPTPNYNTQQYSSPEKNSKLETLLASSNNR